MQTSFEAKRKTSLPSPQTNGADQDDPQPFTRPRRGSLPSRTYPVTRDPSPIRKAKQNDSDTTQGKEEGPSYGLVCQVVEKGDDDDTSGQLMLRSTLSPLSVHCSPKPARRYSTPVNPMKEFYKEVLGFNDKPNDRSTDKQDNDGDAKGTRSLSRPFASPVISRRTSTSSISSDDRSLSQKGSKIPLPVTPREPLLPNLELKLLTKHPPIEPMCVSPISPRKLSLDSTTRRERGKERRRRNTIMNSPFHNSNDVRDTEKQSRDIVTDSHTRRDSSSKSRDESLHEISMGLEAGGAAVGVKPQPSTDISNIINQDTLKVPYDQSRDSSDSSTSSQGKPSGKSKVRARVTIKERRQTTELDTRRTHHNKDYDVYYDDKREQQNKMLRETTSESRDELRDKYPEGKQASKSRRGGKVKARVTIKDRRQTTELDTRTTRCMPRIQFKITDTHDVTSYQSREIPKRKSRVDELKMVEKSPERRSSVPERSRDQYRKQNGCLVRRSSVPSFNCEDDTTKPARNSVSTQELKPKQTSMHRTLSESNARDFKGDNDRNDYGNPWLKHDKTIQRTVSMRRTEGGKSRPSLERARRHTVSTTSPITTTTKHKVISSPRTLKKSLV